MADDRKTLFGVTTLDAVSGAGPVARSDLDEAMDRYACGDATAFALVHRLIARRLRNFLLRLSGDPPLAEDLLQETFLRIHRARSSFASGRAALPWSLAIARNVYIDHLRRPRIETGDADLDRTSSGAPGAEERVVHRESLDIVRTALLQLAPAQREAFVLLRFEQLTPAEAARVLGTTETAVKLRAFRAAETIRRALET